jgi:H+/Cl- antiporter ClcA
MECVTWSSCSCARLCVFRSLREASIWLRQLLDNGAQLAFLGKVGPSLLLVLKPSATVFCLGSGAPGGLFTPSFTVGALPGAVLGYAWALILAWGWSTSFIELTADETDFQGPRVVIPLKFIF